MAKLFKLSNPSEFIKNVRSVVSNDTQNFISLIFYADGMQHHEIYDISVKDFPAITAGAELNVEDFNTLETFVVNYITNLKTEHSQFDSMVVLSLHEDLWTAIKLAEVVSDSGLYANIDVSAVIASDLTEWEDLLFNRNGYVDSSIITNNELLRMILHE